MKYNKELLEYISTSLALGVNFIDISSRLLSVGWDENTVSEHIAFATNDELKNVPVPITDKNYHLWDIFVNLINYISLFIVVITIIVLINKIIGYYYDEYNYNPTLNLSVQLALILTTTPIFIASFINLGKRELKKPELKNILVKKLLNYLVLLSCFITFVVAITMAISSLLAGDMSMGFALKIINVVIIVGLVFFNYFLSVKHDTEIK